jgi:hypothetical protein
LRAAELQNSRGPVSTQVSLSLALPKWTRRVAVDDGGRDPLGLSRVADKLTDHLLQGITTQTRRARYYSFYSWVLWHIAREEAPTTWSAFEQAFRRRDTLFATASLAYDKDSHVAGVDAVGDRLKEAESTKEVRCDYRALPATQPALLGEITAAVELVAAEDKTAPFHCNMLHRGYPGIAMIRRRRTVNFNTSRIHVGA